MFAGVGTLFTLQGFQGMHTGQVWQQMSTHWAVLLARDPLSYTNLSLLARGKFQ